MTFAEYKNRVGGVIQGFAQNISVLSFSLFLSWMVIYLQQAQLWGEFIKVQVWVMITVQVLAWGNKEYLLKAFQKNPDQAENTWSRSFFSRSLLMILLLLIFYSLPVSTALKGWIMAWIIIRFVYQSFEVLVFYKKQFYLSIAAELLGLLLLFVALFKPIPNPTLGHLLKVYVIADMLKAIFMLLVYHDFIRLNFFNRFNLGYLKSALSLFAFSLSVVALAKTDLICVSVLLPSLMVAKYQVLTTCYALIQAVPVFIVFFLLKEVENIEIKKYLRTKKMIGWSGLVICIGSVFLIRHFMIHYFKFDLPITFYLLGVLYILPSYLFAPVAFVLLKRGEEKKLSGIYWLAIGTGLSLNLLLIPLLGMSGALISTGVAQLILLLLFIRQEKNNIVVNAAV